MVALDALHIECAADVRDGKRVVTFTEDGQVCYDPGQGYEDPGVLCRVDALPEPIQARLTQGHKMVLDGMALFVEAMQEAQARVYSAPDEPAFGG